MHLSLPSPAGHLVSETTQLPENEGKIALRLQERNLITDKTSKYSITTKREREMTQEGQIKIQRNCVFKWEDWCSQSLRY